MKCENIEVDAGSGTDVKCVENKTSQQDEFEDEQQRWNEQPTDKKCWITINLYVYVQSTRSMSPMFIVHLQIHSCKNEINIYIGIYTNTHTHLTIRTCHLPLYQIK